MGVTSDGVTEVGKINKISMEQWEERVKAFLLHGQPSQKALVCEGEAGCGKSEVTAQVCRDLGLDPIICPGIGAQQQEEFLALVKLELDEHGNGKVVQGVQESIIPTWKLVESGKYEVEVNGKRKIVIPWIIDEIFTGNMAQANQLRSALTFRQIGSVEIPKGTYKDMEVGVYIIGTTNPEDVIYSSRKSMDAAVMERVSTFRVYMPFEYHQQYLAALARDGKYPELCRLFLRMDEQRDLWNLASPRFWTICFGQSWMELSGAKMHPDDRLALFEAEIADHFQKVALNQAQRGRKAEINQSANAIVSRFKTFIDHGDDPHYYPISANEILRASKDEDEKEVKKHLYLFDHWNSNSQHNFIGVTIQDLMNVTSGMHDVTDEQAKHISDLLNKSGAGIATQFVRGLTSNRKSTDRLADSKVCMQITAKLKGTPMYTAVTKATAKTDQVARELTKQRIEGKLHKVED